jgi:hypothetical protein
MPDVSLLDLVALNNADPIIGLVESAVFSYPELALLDAVPHPGTSYKVGRRTVLPQSQFARVGAGVPTSKSTFVLENKEMFLMNNQLEVPLDYIIAQTRSVGDILSIESKGQMDSAFFHLTQQLYYGNRGSLGGTGYVNDPLGFPGYTQIINGDANFEISAGGASGSSTSCYMLSCHEKGCSLAVGNEGSFNLTQWVQQQIAMAGGNKNQAMVAALIGFFGNSVANEYSVWRIRNIDAAHPLTDALISQLLALVPIQYRINLKLLVNRSGSQSLQQSRTAITQQPADASGTVGWSPEPEFSNKIPITVTEAITNTEV